MGPDTENAELAISSPTPKTVMIELTLDSINYAARTWYAPDRFSTDIGDACRKYLDENRP